MRVLALMCTVSDFDAVCLTGVETTVWSSETRRSDAADTRLACLASEVVVRPAR